MYSDKRIKEMSANNILGMALRDARLDMGISQKEFAKCLGVSLSALSCYENGRRKAPFDKFVLWCYKLQFDPIDLMHPYIIRCQNQKKRKVNNGA